MESSVSPGVSSPSLMGLLSSHPGSEWPCLPAERLLIPPEAGPRLAGSPPASAGSSVHLSKADVVYVGLVSLSAVSSVTWCAQALALPLRNHRRWEGAGVTGQAGRRLRTHPGFQEGVPPPSPALQLPEGITEQLGGRAQRDCGGRGEAGEATGLRHGSRAAAAGLRGTRVGGVGGPI